MFQSTLKSSMIEPGAQFLAYLSFNPLTQVNGKL